MKQEERLGTELVDPFSTLMQNRVRSIVFVSFVYEYTPGIIVSTIFNSTNSIVLLQLNSFCNYNY